MSALEILILVGIPTFAVCAMAVYDHYRARLTRAHDPLADLARRLEQGVVD